MKDQQVLKLGIIRERAESYLADRSSFRAQSAGTNSLRFPEAGPAAALGAMSAYIHSPGKRLFDIIFATCALTALAPLLLLTAAAVALTSEGPVLFRQRRSGLGGEPFEILKFRSMFTDGGNEDAVVQATESDPRITPLGRFLRRTSLDELPQLINVLRGDMSIVGPRPHAIDHDELFARRAPNYDVRFVTRPGITGLAQVCGARGPTPDKSSVVLRTNFDIEYVCHASFALDMKIIFLTVGEIFESKTAF